MFSYYPYIFTVSDILYLLMLISK